jgi:hypothetical protein
MTPAVQTRCKGTRIFVKSDCNAAKNSSVLPFGLAGKASFVTLVSARSVLQKPDTAFKFYQFRPIRFSLVITLQEWICGFSMSPQG